MESSDATVERYVVAARLRPGAAAAAEELLSAGPPFDPAEAGFTGHAAYLGDEFVYLVFEGPAARSKAQGLARRHPVEVARWQTVTRDLPTRVAEVPPAARRLYGWPPDG
ncbi:MAG TPA: hypothetical protein VH416_00960 [Gaiellaceae bacterium]|jgi:hypothetical protein